MDIVVFGAGVQGTLYAVRLARAGHAVTLIARGRRADELRRTGAVIRDAMTGECHSLNLPIFETLPSTLCAPLCFVFVRREQTDIALDALANAGGLDRIVWMVNHACGSETLHRRLGRDRIVLGFPGAAGSIEEGVDVYLDIPEQPTVIEAGAPEVAVLLRSAGFHTRIVRDMDAWLIRHAIMITAIACSVLTKGGNARHVGQDRALVRAVILAIREGWHALDASLVAPGPLALRAIFCWVPLPLAVHYWSHLLGSERGDVYFARHIRRNVDEIRALTSDLTWLVYETNRTPQLRRLYSVLKSQEQTDI